MRFSKWPAGVAALLAAAMLQSACGSKAAAPASGGPPPGPTEVAVVALQPERLVLTTQLPGRTTAYLTAEIRPQVNGIVQNRLFQEGTLVEQGATLYRIDPAPYQAAVAQAKASVATAEADLVTAQANLPSLKSRAARYGDLVAIHAIGQQDYDDARSALDQANAMVEARKAAIVAARAALESAQINLAYTPIKAPIKGRIGKSNITVGSLATAYQPTPLAVIQQIDPIYVDVVQANADLLRLRKNMETGRLRGDVAQRKVKLLLEDGSAYPIDGALQFRDVTVDSTTGAVTLRIVFRNPREILLPGMFVRAVVEEGVREQAILVPMQAVLRDPKGQPYSWVVGADGKVERRPLDLERTIGSRWLVIKGLGPDDRVIVEGVDKVRVGTEVRAVPFQGALGGPNV